MSSNRINLLKGIIIALVAILVILIGSVFMTRYLRHSQWISMPIDTQAMSDARALLPYGKLIAKSILTEPYSVEKNKLHVALLYPQVHTVICTVDKPEDFDGFAMYLVSDNGKVFPGWYNPENMGDIASEKYGIVKVMFENLTTNQIKELHVVEKSAVTIPYDPNSNIRKLVYELDSPTNSEVALMKDAAAASSSSSSN